MKERKKEEITTVKFIKQIKPKALSNGYPKSYIYELNLSFSYFKINIKIFHELKLVVLLMAQLLLSNKIKL